MAVVPCAAQARRTSGFVVILATSALSLATTAGGVPRGAIKPSQIVAS